MMESSLESLPRDLLTWMLTSPLLTPTDLSRLARTCRRLRDVVASRVIWQTQNERYFSCDTEAAPLLVPRCATENLVQRGSFRRSAREAAMLNARRSMMGFAIGVEDNPQHVFAASLQRYRTVVWPCAAFYVGLEDAAMANVTSRPRVLPFPIPPHNMIFAGYLWLYSR